jgi:CheY-like chemotaxis protein
VPGQLQQRRGAPVRRNGDDLHVARVLADEHVALPVTIRSHLPRDVKTRIILAGRPSMGKSLMCKYLAKRELARIQRVGDDSACVVYVSLEEADWVVGMGLDVDCAPDLAAARRMLAGGRYALCLTDMRLPDGDGLALVAEIGEAHPDTPVAVITAYGSAETAVAALKAGAFDYLSKPVGLESLRALVRSALRLSVDLGGADAPREPGRPSGPRAAAA